MCESLARLGRGKALAELSWSVRGEKLMGIYKMLLGKRS